MFCNCVRAAMVGDVCKFFLSPRAPREKRESFERRSPLLNARSYKEGGYLRLFRDLCARRVRHRSPY